ncbi:hypothetical protein [Nocardia bovistercoris]|uniref:Uncharacterized protein n=1 Tax=Nocardia bovistercoris TaxID=2785916 RepID=A0A931N4K2_9NOCA|nr:hypothetical protein [Nocardia bovistercoris]MBH0778792.1 hypothetical protein [Nocardia bovistercoris]
MHEPHRAGHGTAACYRTGCPRPECREAVRVYTAELRARRFALRVTGTNGKPYAATDLKGRALPHGLSTYREWGCRCDVCGEASTAATAAYRQTRRAAA